MTARTGQRTTPTPETRQVSKVEPRSGQTEELQTILRVCEERGVDDYATFCAVLTGWAESDFISRKHPTDETYGVFQQNPRWWKSARGTTAEQCSAFLDEFSKIRRTGNSIWDCWQVQRWTTDEQPTPLTDSSAFSKLPNTINYLNHRPGVAMMIKTGRVS